MRQIRTLTQVGERKPLAAVLSAPREHERAALQEHAASVRALAFLESYEVCERAERPPSSAVAVAGGVEIFVTLGEDVDLAQLAGVLEKRAEKLRNGILGTEKKLSNERFVQNADPAIVELERERKLELETELGMLERNLQGLV